MPLGASRLNLLSKVLTAAAPARRTANTITTVSDAQVSTGSNQFGGASLVLDGVDDYLQVGDGSETDFQFGSNDFTIEGWINPDAINTSGSPMEPLFSKYKTSNNQRMLSFGIYDGFLGYFWATSGSSGNVVQTSQAISTGSWKHIALCREGNTWNTYYDGNRVDTRTISGTLFASTEPVLIGKYAGFTNNEIDGYIDEVRVSDTARYTGATYTVPTGPFTNDSNTLLLLHMDGTNGSTTFYDDNGDRELNGISAQGNAQVDTGQSQFGGASAEFDGSGDYLTIDKTWELDGDYTIECWVRLNNVSGGKGIIGSDDTSPFQSLEVFNDTIQWNNPYMDFTTTANTWFHVAVVRSGSTVKLFKDGTQQGSDGTDSNTIFALSETNELRIGRNAFTAYMNGYIDEIRISSTARYTGNFTVETGAFTNDSDTLLLIHADGTNASTDFFDDNGRE